jgi:site-specific DNA recombinase
MRFNYVEARSRRRKSPSEQVFAEVPSIIEPQVFDAVQSNLKTRNPRVTPPRVVSGPILLTGLAVCAACRGAMTLRTGTSKTGKVHRYYTCSTCARHGRIACKGRSIRMDQLDTLVTTHLADRLLKTERLTTLLTSLAGRRAAKAAAVDQRIGALEKEALEADERLRRLYTLVEDGRTEPDQILKDRISAIRTDGDLARAALERARASAHHNVEISPILVERFGQAMREKLSSGEVQFRKAYLGAIVDRVEVDDHVVRIVGRKDVLEQAILANGAHVPRVRSFVRKWRSLRESNPSFQIENLTS